MKEENFRLHREKRKRTKVIYANSRSITTTLKKRWWYQFKVVDTILIENGVLITISPTKKSRGILYM